MASTITLTPIRSIKRANSGRKPIAEYIGAMAETFEALKTAPWRRAFTPLQDVVLSINDPLREDYGGDEYDAYRQSGDSIIINNAGDQLHNVWAGMSCYTLELPPAAASTFIRELSFRLDADKNAVGGVKVAAFLSNNALPPTDWEACRRGGTDNALDTSGMFATPEEDFTAPEGDKAYADQMKKGVVFPSRVGVLAETAPLRSLSTHRSDVFSLDLSAETGAWRYVHICVSMFVGVAWRTQYWVEGCAKLRGDSISVTLDADGIGGDTEPFAAAYGFRVALEYAAPSKQLRFRYSRNNITDLHYGIDYGAKNALINGPGNLYTGNDLVTEVTRSALAPSVFVESASGNNTTLAVRKGAVVFNCPRDVPTGAFLWFKAFEGFVGARTPLRLLVYAGAVDLATAGAWTGAGSVGMVELNGVTPGQVIGIPLKAFGATSALTVLACIPEVAREDVFASTPLARAFGFTQKIGFDFRDAHVAKRYSPSVDNSGWTAPAPVAIPDADYVPPPPLMVFDNFTVSVLNAQGGVVSTTTVGDNGTFNFIATAGAVVRVKANVSGGKLPNTGTWLATSLKTQTSWNLCEFTVSGENDAIIFEGLDSATPQQSVFAQFNIHREHLPIFSIVSTGAISPGTVSAQKGTTPAAFTLSGVNVEQDGAPSTAYTIQWQSRERITATSWGVWQDVAGATGATCTPSAGHQRSAEYRVRISAGSTSLGNAVSATSSAATLEIWQAEAGHEFASWLFPWDNKLPYIDSATVGLYNNSKQPLVGQIFFEGISTDSSAAGNYGKGLGLVGANTASVSLIETRLGEARSTSNIAAGNRFNWSFPTRRASDWSDFSRRAGIEFNRRGGVYGDPPQEHLVNVVTVPVLYFTYFLKLAAGESISKVVIPFNNSLGQYSNEQYILFLANVWMLDKITGEDEQSAPDYGRAQVNSEMPNKMFKSTIAYTPGLTFGVHSSQDTAPGSGLKRFFFSQTLGVDWVSGIYSEREKTATRMGNFLETETNKLNGAREVNCVIAAASEDRIIPIVLTLAPHRIVTTGNVPAYLNNMLNAIHGTGKPFGTTSFVGIGMHDYSGTTNPIFSGWDTPPGQWYIPPNGTLVTGPHGGDNQGRPLGTPNPASYRNGFGYMPYGGSNNPQGNNGIIFTGSKRVIL